LEEDDPLFGLACRRKSETSMIELERPLKVSNAEGDDADAWFHSRYFCPSNLIMSNRQMVKRGVLIAA
jgi:hypothetical protein